MSSTNSLYLLCQSGKIRNAGSSALGVYTCLRALAIKPMSDISLRVSKIYWQRTANWAAFVDVSDLQKMLGEEEDAVRTAIDVLTKLGWVEVDTEQGHVGYVVCKNGEWLCDSEVTEQKLQTIGRIRKQAAAGHKRVALNGNSSGLFKSPHDEKKMGKDLWRYYLRVYETVYAAKSPEHTLFEAAQSSKGIRLFRALGSDFRKSRDFVSFCIENWSKIKEHVGWWLRNEYRPSWEEITKQQTIAKIVGLFEDGFPSDNSGVAKRGTSTDWAKASEQW